jgi:hypothetical protein
VHRIEVEEVADDDLGAQVAKGLGALVVTSHHRAHGFALLQQQLGDRAPDPAGAAGGAGNQSETSHPRPQCGCAAEAGTVNFTVLDCPG